MDIDLSSNGKVHWNQTLCHWNKKQNINIHKFFLGDYIFGHYHLFMDEEVNGNRFICPSSVGMPFNGDSRAQYIILDIIEGKITTSRQYVEYDKLKLVEDFDKKGYLEKYTSWSKDISCYCTNRT